MSRHVVAITTMTPLSGGNNPSEVTQRVVLLCRSFGGCQLAPRVVRDTRVRAR